EIEILHAGKRQNFGFSPTAAAEARDAEDTDARERGSEIGFGEEVFRAVEAEGAVDVVVFSGDDAFSEKTWRRDVASRIGSAFWRWLWRRRGRLREQTGGRT